jgi:hypothetical protein
LTSSGSYYVTANLTGISGSNGITISAGNIDLDLMGFALTGVSGSGDGIKVPATEFNIVVHNGTLQGWGGCGVNASNANNSHLEQMRAFNNAAGGLAVGSASAIANCEASSNQIVGISVGNGSRVKDCTAMNTATIIVGGSQTGAGIAGGSAVVISGCVSTLNGWYGISVGDGSAVSSCSVASNAVYGARGGGVSTGNNCTVIGCSASWNYALGSLSLGIGTGNASIIKDCTANLNGTGISTGNFCSIVDCTACSNIYQGGGYGFNLGSGCIVRGCLVQGNDYGGIWYGTGSLISDNLTSGNQNIAAYADAVTSGSNSVVIRNLVGTNNFAVENNSTLNAVGTLDTPTILNTDKDPQANFTHP